MYRQHFPVFPIFFLIAGLGLSQPAAAQQPQTEIEAVQEIWGMVKKELVDQYMQFSDTEAAAFWPVYEAYMAERQKLSNDRIRILAEYADQYDRLTDQKAEDLTYVALVNDIKLDKLKKKYFKKFKKAVSPLRASQFMQLENYLQTAIRHEVQEAIPFIGELERKRQ